MRTQRQQETRKLELYAQLNSVIEDMVKAIEEGKAEPNEGFFKMKQDKIVELRFRIEEINISLGIETMVKSN